MRTPVLRALSCAAALFVLTVAHTANAATSAPGVNLRWDKCYGDGGAWNKLFACDTNVGTDELVGSMELGSDLPQVTGIEANFEIVSESATLPAWWGFRSVGSCRTSSLTMDMTPPAGSVVCQDWSAGQASGGIGAYAQVFANQRTVMTAIAVPSSAFQDLHAGQEYFVARLRINHAKTVGTGACGGCNTPVCVLFAGVVIDYSSSIIPVKLTRGANYVGSQYATWQNGYPIGIIHYCETFSLQSSCQGARANFSCVLATPTNSRGSTWGAVKALYR